jgi:phosphonate transport system permease protein
MAEFKNIMPQRPKIQYIRYTLIAVISLLIVIWGFSAIEYNGQMRTAIPITKGIINGMLHPNMEYLFPIDAEVGRVTLKSFFGVDNLAFIMVETIAIAVAGTFISSFLAIPFALLSSENIVGERLSKVGKFIISAIRTFPEIILAIIFVVIVGVGPKAGVLALGLHSVGMLGKLFSESIESMDIGVKEAVISVGGNRMEVLFRAVLPQVAPEFLSYTLFRFEINMRAATILGVVGGGGIGAPLILALNSSSQAAWNKISIMLIVLLITVTIIDQISGFIRKKLA